MSLCDFTIIKIPSTNVNKKTADPVSPFAIRKSVCGSENSVKSAVCNARIETLASIKLIERSEISI